ncbi:ComFC Predicted amidophosphoribosyltransferases [Candidatus Nanopelagicaceae bacterium]
MKLANLVVTSSVPYSDVAQKVILSAKESQIKRADELVSSAISHSVAKVLRNQRCDFLVPIPSRPSAVRKRGRHFILEVARDASQRFDLPIRDLLGHTRTVRDQSGLHLQERRNNLEGALVVRGKERADGKALLIDDLVTTGATLSEAARALRYAGIEVIGAVTASIAQPLRYRDEMG